MIAFTVNGKKIEMESPLSISTYLDSVHVNPATVVVELNYEIPDRQQWAEILLKDEDNLEIVKFIGGG